MAIVGTLTRADLSDALQREVGLSRADSAKLVEEILDHMCDALARGDVGAHAGVERAVLAVGQDVNEAAGHRARTGDGSPLSRDDG